MFEFLTELTEVEEDEFGLDGRTQFDDEGDGHIDDQQPQHQPPQLPQKTQPEDTLQLILAQDPDQDQNPTHGGPRPGPNPQCTKTRI